MTNKDFQGKVRIIFSYDAEEYGYPMMTNGSESVGDFINSINTIRIAMLDYLNEKVPHKYQIIDQNI